MRGLRWRGKRGFFVVRTARAHYRTGDVGKRAEVLWFQHAERVIGKMGVGDRRPGDRRQEEAGDRQETHNMGHG